MVLVSFVIAITIHEFMHAYTAHKLGDDTARRLGRITFNPIEHFDPIGFFGMVLIAMGFPFIGWGKPVPVQPGNFRGKWATRRKEGMLLVAAAGPLSNVAQALIVALPFQYMYRNNLGDSALMEFLLTFIQINILLAAFNMIPIPPLDGYKILTGILPNFWTPILRPLEQYGFMILFLFIIVGNQLGAGSVLSTMISPVYNALFRVAMTGLL
jgi:Zn-dependent protease